jgi:hypothetical protein
VVPSPRRRKRGASPLQTPPRWRLRDEKGASPLQPCSFDPICLPKHTNHALGPQHDQTWNKRVQNIGYIKHVGPMSPGAKHASSHMYLCTYICACRWISQLQRNLWDHESKHHVLGTRPCKLLALGAQTIKHRGPRTAVTRPSGVPLRKRARFHAETAVTRPAGVPLASVSLACLRTSEKRKDITSEMFSQFQNIQLRP